MSSVFGLGRSVRTVLSGGTGWPFGESGGAEDLEDRPGREDLEDGEDAPKSRRGRHAGRIACLTFSTGKSACVTFVCCRQREMTKPASVFSGGRRPAAGGNGGACYNNSY